MREDGKYDGRLGLHRLHTSIAIPIILYGIRIHHNTHSGAIPMKRYPIRCPFCGSEETKMEWWLKLRLIFTDKYYYDCPICHKKSSWLYFFHLRHDSTDKTERLFNKGKLFDDRI